MNWSDEYSEEFDQLRKNRVKISFYKYGSVKVNYANGLIAAIPTAERCIEKYRETGNTEYLCDAANYLMFEFMYPKIEGAHFRATGSAESAGVVGMGIKQMEESCNDRD